MCKRTILSILFFCLFCVNSYSQTNGNAETLINSGLADIYNLKFDNAVSTFKEVQRLYPNDVKGYFYESLVYFYSAMGSRNESEFEKYMAASDIVIEKADDLIDQNENNFDAIYYKGQSHSYRSLLLLTLNKNLITAASNGSDGYRILNDVIKRKPDYYDAYMGLGLYKIFIGLVPEKFQWLLSIIGFDGDIKEGVNLLRTAAQNGRFTRVDSKIALALFTLQEREEKDESMVKTIEAISAQYPESPMFKMMHAGALQLQGKTEESLPLLEDALRLNKFSMQNEVNKGANGLLGNVYFKRNDYANAVKYLEEHLKYVHPEDRYNISIYNLGVAYEMSGNRQKALEKYRSVRDVFINERDGETEKLFYRFAQDRIKNPMNRLDSILTLGLNLRESNKLNEAVSFYENILASDILDSYKTDDDKVRLYYEAALTYNVNGQTDLAQEYFNRITNLKPKTENWYVPFSYFELGKIYSRKGDNQKAEQMFKKISDFEEFEMKQALEMRLRTFRERH